jgi:hypothetical protein
VKTASCLFVLILTTPKAAPSNHQTKALSTNDQSRC